MDMVYAVYCTCDYFDELHTETVEGIFYDEKTAKETVDILNKQAEDEAPWLDYSYYGTKVYGTVEDFMKENKNE